MKYDGVHQDKGATMTNRRRFTGQFKAEVVLEVLTGRKSAAQVCREHGIKEPVLSAWKRELVERAPQLFERNGANTEADKRTDELERMVGGLTMELEISKKALLLLTQGQTGRGS